MSECILDIDSLQVESRDYSVFFATHDFIVYKDHLDLYLAACDGETLSSAQCPRDHRDFECCDLGSSILFIFGGQHVVLMHKDGRAPETHQLKVHKFGKCITPLWRIDGDVIFGCRSRDQVHFVRYDCSERKRIFQTRSWKMGEISDLQIQGGNLYGLFDNAYIACCNAQTGEPLWTRFETGVIKPRLLQYDENLLYACRGLLKRASRKDIDTIRIPLARPWTLEHVHKNNLYFTTDSGKNLACYDLKKGDVLWRIKGRAPIQQTTVVQGKTKNKIHDIMIIRLPDFLSIVDLTVGRSIQYLQSNRIRRVRRTGNHLLLHKQYGHTDMIAGLSDG